MRRRVKMLKRVEQRAKSQKMRRKQMTKRLVLVATLSNSIASSTKETQEDLSLTTLLLQ